MSKDHEIIVSLRTERGSRMAEIRGIMNSRDAHESHEEVPWTQQRSDFSGILMRIFSARPPSSAPKAGNRAKGPSPWASKASHRSGKDGKRASARRLSAAHQPARPLAGELVA